MRRSTTLIALVLLATACGTASPPESPAPREAADLPRAEMEPGSDSGATPSSATSDAARDGVETSTSNADPADGGAAGGAGDEPALGPRMAPDRWWHLDEVEPGVPSAGLDRAHALLAGRTPARQIVVAVIDGGVDVQHEDLDDVLWVNPGEVDGNGVDDDGNGYVDDLHGWNFIGGPDGRNVGHDTYEMTRLHAACIGGAAGRGLAKPSPELCTEVAEAFDQEHEEMTAIQGQIAEIQQVYPIVIGILKGAIGAEPTFQNVAALETSDPRVTQARAVYLQLAAAGIDEELLTDEAEDVEGRLKYGLDTEFDPRTIVGDDYADPTERYYGNADVEGPDPSHGTGVASVIGAERDNGLGIDGAADGVRLMILRAVPDGDERDKDVANAIRYAVDNGADVINMSFGKGYSPWKSTVDDAVRYADEHGVLLVHASGNDGEDLAEAGNFPNARYEDGGSPSLWIEVGASAWQAPDSLAANFSNYGASQVDVFAPGVAMRMAAPDNEYKAHDGTSFSAPLVSGVAALLLAYFPDLDATEVRRVILETATDESERTVARPGDKGGVVRFGDLSVSGGVVNAAAAVQWALDREQRQ